MKKTSRKNTIVAVRMPRSLLDELKGLQKVNHFMDISEEIRFVIRKYANTSGSGMFVELKRKEKLIKELNKIIGQLKEGENAQ